MKGRNRQGCPVFFEGDADELKGQLVPVLVTQAHPYYLVGERQAERFAGGGAGASAAAARLRGLAAGFEASGSAARLAGFFLAGPSSALALAARLRGGMRSSSRDAGRRD